MATRRVSVMIEVDDGVNSAVVEPHKRNKTFSKLVATLLSGYVNDGYIRAFVDDNLEEVRRAVVDSFADSVGDMESALSSMGLLADQLSAHATAGYSKFTQRRDKQAEELDKDMPPVGHEKQTPKSEDREVAELKEKVGNIEKNMTEGFNQIINLINSMAMGAQSRGTSTDASDSAVASKAKEILAGSSAVISVPVPIVPTNIATAEYGGGGYEDNYNPNGDGEEKSEAADIFLTNIMSDFGVY